MGARGAERAVPLAPHITGLTPDELQRIDSFKAAREAYLAELQTLDANARSDELRRLMQAAGAIPDFRSG